MGKKQKQCLYIMLNCVCFISLGNSYTIHFVDVGLQVYWRVRLHRLDPCTGHVALKLALHRALQALEWTAHQIVAVAMGKSMVKFWQIFGGWTSIMSNWWPKVIPKMCLSSQPIVSIMIEQQPPMTSLGWTRVHGMKFQNMYQCAYIYREMGCIFQVQYAYTS